MGFFWPTHLNSQPYLLTRLGRLAHWVGLLIGLAIVALAIFLNQVARGDEDGLWMMGAFGLIPYFVGRGARYVLASE